MLPPPALARPPPPALEPAEPALPPGGAADDGASLLATQAARQTQTHSDATHDANEFSKIKSSSVGFRVR